MFLVTLVYKKKVNINRNTLQRNFTRKKNLGVPIIVASFGEKNIYFIM